MLELDTASAAVRRLAAEPQEPGDVALGWEPGDAGGVRIFWQPAPARRLGVVGYYTDHSHAELQIVAEEILGVVGRL